MIQTRGSYLGFFLFSMLLLFLCSPRKAAGIESASTTTNLSFEEATVLEAKLELYELAMRAFKREGDITLQAICLEEIGDTHARLNRTRAAIQSMEQAYGLRRTLKVPDRYAEIRTLERLAALYEKSGVPLRALAVNETLQKLREARPEGESTVVGRLKEWIAGRKAPRRDQDLRVASSGAD